MTTHPTTRSVPSSHHRDARALSNQPTRGRAAATIADQPFFAGLDDVEIASLIGDAETLRFEPDETLFVCGDPGDSVLLVLSGRVAVESHRSNGERVTVNVVESGELVGEMAVLEGTTRSASVTALEPCEVLVIPHEEFLALLVNHPGFAIRILGTVTARLRGLTGKVVGTP